MSTITNFSIKNPQPFDVVLPLYEIGLSDSRSTTPFFYICLDHGILLNLCRFENSQIRRNAPFALDGRRFTGRRWRCRRRYCSPPCS